MLLTFRQGSEDSGCELNKPEVFSHFTSLDATQPAKPHCQSA